MTKIVHISNDISRTHVISLSLKSISHTLGLTLGKMFNEKKNLCARGGVETACSQVLLPQLV
jgi:hypothetical protein